MARMARKLGFVGIIDDNEEYPDDKWFNYQEDYENPLYSLNEHAEQVKLRGGQIMQATTAEFAAVKVITYHGSYFSALNDRTKSIIMGRRRVGIITNCWGRFLSA